MIRKPGMILALLGVGSLLALLVATRLVSMPRFEQVRADWRPSDAQLLDRNGAPIDEVRIDRQGLRLAWVSVDNISPALQRAVIAAEDHRFLSHAGVDFISLGGAIARRIAGRRSGGASTITMQLASLLDLSLNPGRGHRTIAQKLRQMLLALSLERSWSKRQILEAYLNLVTWRGELTGVEAASRVMFGKEPHGLTTADAIVLASLLRAPNARFAALERRAETVRTRISTDRPGSSEVRLAIVNALARRESGLKRITLAPHLGSRLLSVATPSVRCTLDRDLQAFASDSLRRHVAEVRDRHVEDGAVLVVENRTGKVWAYVASTDDLSSAPLVDGVRAARQPGSALKPFLYALAIERGLLTPASLLEDTPLEVPEQRGLYRPLDYDRQFRGLVSVRTALASSLNVPAVRTADLVGVEAFSNHLRDLGFAGLVEQGDFYGAALALGSGDVTLWEMVNAYRVLANGGSLTPLRVVSDDRDGPARRIYARATAFLVSDILADRASRSSTFGLENSLATRYWSAVKTGTSKDMRDNWCIGYTDRFTVGVWVGNFSGAPMRDVSGITGAAPVWLEVMNYLHDRFGSGSPVPPAGVISSPVSFPHSVEAPRAEWFAAGTEPHAAAIALDVSRARITSPANGTIVALDPDVPQNLQRVTFSASGATSHLRWRLDRREVGAARLTMWAPARGSHRLELIDGSARVIDSIAFRVGPISLASLPN